MVIPAHRVRAGGISNEASDGTSTVVALGDGRATAVDLVGAKAANLATIAAAGLPVLPGFAIPVGVAGRALSPGELDELHSAWQALSNGGSAPLVVRSSAVGEDGEASSMAGRFTSILGVQGWRAFREAVDRVVESADVVTLDGSGTHEQHEMGVLVQPFLEATYGGVLFGADPITARRDRIVLASVRGGPDRLVSGEDTGASQILSLHGRVLLGEGDADAVVGRAVRHRLVTLSRRAANVFGGPQDLEWAIDADGRVWVLQSRPVTALAAGGMATGPVLGPGPVAETFPDPLTALEQDLWLDPLRAGVIHALDLSGGVPRKRLASSPVVVAVDGRAAVDLDLFGAIPQRSSLWRRLDPRPPARRLRAAWRTGRLRRAMPTLAGALVSRVDAELATVPSLPSLSERALVDVLHGSQRLLVAVHGQEVLAGLLLGERDIAKATPGGAALALRALAAARAAGEPEERIAARHPEVLALVPPAVRPGTLPPCTAVLPDDGGEPTLGDPTDPAVFREQLRMRARWVQELGAMAAWELGMRLSSRGALATAEGVRGLSLADLEALVDGGGSTTTSDGPAHAGGGAPLPAAFRLDASGRPVAVVVGDVASAKAGQGAGGGRRAGTVVHHAADAMASSEPVVLVTTTLSPELAAVLPSLAGLVAETGSVLSHLAILARELGVPTVVGVRDAMSRYAHGATVIVDGAAGTIEIVEAAVGTAST